MKKRRERENEQQKISKSCRICHDCNYGAIDIGFWIVVFLKWTGGYFSVIAIFISTKVFSKNFSRYFLYHNRYNWQFSL